MELVEDVTKWIKTGWVKCRGAFGGLYNCRILLRLKSKFYRTIVRTVKKQGLECFAIKKQHIQRMTVIEMRILKWMPAVTREDWLMNELGRID